MIDARFVLRCLNHLSKTATGKAHWCTLIPPTPASCNGFYQ